MCFVSVQELLFCLREFKICFDFKNGVDLVNVVLLQVKVRKNCFIDLLNCFLLGKFLIVNGERFVCVEGKLEILKCLVNFVDCVLNL